jgi:hypothetical protein
MLTPPPQDDEVDEKTGKKKEPVVAISQRAWPLIDMLERTSKGAQSKYCLGSVG